MAKHPVMRFRNFGGIHQFTLADDGDLARIDRLDPARWAATSAPLGDLHTDPAFLAAMDPGGTGRIRVSQLIAARDWLFERLAPAGREGVAKRSDVLALSALDTSKEPGQKLKAAAEDVIKQRALPDKERLALAEVRAFRSSYQKTLPNGDGVVPADVVKEPEVAGVIKDIVATTGGAKDVGGSDGVGQAEVDRFVERAKAWLAWNARRKDVLPWGDDTPAAAALVAALDGKIEEYLLHGELLRLEPAAADASAPTADDLRPVRLREAGAVEKYLAASPLAVPVATATLALGGPINPIYRDQVEELRAKVLGRALGQAPELTRESWRKVKALFAAYAAWQKDKPAEPFDKLGEERVKAILEGKELAKVAEYIGIDKAAAPHIAQVGDLERLILLQRGLLDLANNFVNFSAIFNPTQQALVEMGSLVIDGRRLDFCMKVVDRANHKKLAASSLIYLVYATITEKDGATPAYEIAAPVTAGERGRLRVGKRGVFYDNDGKEWDAQVTEILEFGISVKEAMFAPFRRVSQFMGKKIEDWVASSQAAQEKSLMAQADKSVTVATTQVEASAKAAADAKAAAPAAAAAPGAAAAPAPGGKPAGKGIDVNSVILGGGIALGGLAAVFGAMFGLLAAVKGWIAIGGVVVAVMALSGLLGWLKLRKRDLGMLLEANGWALNLSMKVNRRIARVFTFVPALPPGSVKERLDLLATKEDRAAERRRKLVLALVVVVGLAIVYWWFFLGHPLPGFLQRALRAASPAK